jgi:hypothetical protein
MAGCHWRKQDRSDWPEHRKAARDPGRHSGESRNPVPLADHSKTLDDRHSPLKITSGFRRNDGYGA